MSQTHRKDRCYSNRRKPTHRSYSATCLLLPVLFAPNCVVAQIVEATKAVQRLEQIDVVGTQPLPGLDLPRERIAANVLTVDKAAIERGRGQSLVELINTALPSVNLNSVLGNAVQSDVIFRGFSASPLLGAAQGLSVFVDGMRLNEPFAEVVNWDMIPAVAIESIQLFPGSNPLFGLNTLGGALSVTTKTGALNPGLNTRAQAGSRNFFGTETEYGAKLPVGSLYVAANLSRDDGWRKFSKNTVRQGFAKLQLDPDDRNEITLSVAAASNAFSGNGFVPTSFVAREGITAGYTYGDKTEHTGGFAILNWRSELGGSSIASMQGYVRRLNEKVVNADINQISDPRYDVKPYEDSPETSKAGSLNVSKTRQLATGVAAQLAIPLRIDSQLTLGVAFDQGGATYMRSYALGDITEARRVDVSSAGAGTPIVDLRGRSQSIGLYAASVYRLAPAWTLNAAARWNEHHVATTDLLDPALPTPARGLDNDFRYRKLNPSLGLTWVPGGGWSGFLGASQGSRAPNPVELACADRASPCLLPNAMASDPYLKQVVTQTVETGLRFPVLGLARGFVGAYRAVSRDDILFVSTGTSGGYFTNFGKTRRRGVELGLSGKGTGLDWSAAYALVDASYQSSGVIRAPNNSTRGQDAALADDEIRIHPGNTIPGVPRHSLKLSLEYAVLPDLKLGVEAVSFSSEFLRGNENNQHQAGAATDASGTTRTYFGAGRVPGYAILNFNATYTLAPNWRMQLRVNNALNRRFYNDGTLAANAFPNGRFEADPEAWRREAFYAPGSSRAFFVSLNWSPS